MWSGDDVAFRYCSKKLGKTPFFLVWWEYLGETFGQGFGQGFGQRFQQRLGECFQEYLGESF